ncbi:MAG: hypothetical protein RL653_1530 [Pseudomonadota bacterium]|jgi:uncharacterized protein (DUF697 family)/GTP-binding protein EngB required for normal cell division
MALLPLDQPFDVTSAMKESLQKAFDDIKRVNVIVAGRSGAGKSTLLNAVFEGNLAATGQGRPVTQKTTEYTREGVPLAILDTRGLEMDQYQETVSSLEKLIAERRSSNDVDKQPHVAWVCIPEDSRRVEDGERKIVEMFARYDVPVVAVITKARNDQGFSAEVHNLLPTARNVSRVRALSEVDEEGNTLKQKGLPELIELTANLVPEAQRTAFAAVQKVNLELKKARAQKYVTAAAVSAAGVAAAPVPFADAALIIPIQVSMIAGISVAFGLPADRAFLSTIVSSSLTALGGTVIGRAIVSGLLKLIPGANLAGSAISAATAATLTTTFGTLYISVLSALYERNNGAPLEPGQVASELKSAIDRHTQG